MKNRTAAAWGAAFGLLAVVLGAMGAHALRAELSAGQLESFHTAVRYQAWHALALLALSSYGKIHYLRGIMSCWIVGIFLFSGSIYLLSTQDLLNVNLSFLGPITPVGGITFIAGWFLLLLSSLKKSPSPKTNVQSPD